MLKLQDLKRNRDHRVASFRTRIVPPPDLDRDQRIKDRDLTAIQGAVVPVHQDQTVIPPRQDQIRVQILKMIAESRKKLPRTELVEKQVPKCQCLRNLAGKMSK